MMGADKRQRVRGDDRRIGGEAAPDLADDWVVGVGVEVNHWSEVEIDAKLRQCLGDGACNVIGGGDVVRFT